MTLVKCYKATKKKKRFGGREMADGLLEMGVINQEQGSLIKRACTYSTWCTLVPCYSCLKLVHPRVGSPVVRVDWSTSHWVLPSAAG